MIFDDKLRPQIVSVGTTENVPFSSLTGMDGDYQSFKTPEISVLHTILQFRYIRFNLTITHKSKDVYFYSVSSLKKVSKMHKKNSHCVIKQKLFIDS